MGTSASKAAGWAMADARPGLNCPTSLGSSFRGSLGFRNVPDFKEPKISQYNLFKWGSGSPRFGGNYTPFTYASNFQNEAAALALRALKVTPLVDAQEMKKFCNWVKKDGLKALLPTFRKHWPASFQSYIQNSNASPSVKAALQRARDKLDSKGITEWSKLDRNQLYRWTLRKSFIKMENNMYTTPLGNTWKPPRLIQGGQPEFVSLVGPTFMTIQAELKRCMSIIDPVVFTSGVSGAEAANHVNVPGWNIFENDVSSWDASIHEELANLECWIAGWMGAGQAVTDLMHANVRTHGFTTHGCKYKIPGTRKSGDPFTSCFNSLLNALLHLYCFVRGEAERFPVGSKERDSLLGIAKRILQSIRMLVQGDDNLMVYHPTLRPRFDLLLKLGFKADNIHRSTIMDAEFCSCHMFRMRDGSLSFGPKLGRLLLKFMSFIEPPKHENPLSLARGVAIGHYPASSFIPGLRKILDRVLILTSGVKAVMPKNDDYKLKFSVLEGDYLENLYFMDKRYYLAPLMDSFNSFWDSAVFGSDLSTCVAHIAMFDQDSSGPTEFPKLMPIAL
jgi:hypothetical protein